MKRATQRILSIILSLCTILTFLPTTTYAALDSRVERAISWAISIANDNSHGYSQTHRNGPDYDCSSFVSTAFRQGGFNVSGSNWTGSMEQAFTSVGFKAYAANSVTLQRGDIVLRHDNVRQHVELYLGNNQFVGAHWDYDGQTGDGSGEEIDVYYDYAPSWYTRVLRYEGGSSTPTVKEYFSCNIQINTTRGKTVNLFSQPTDSSRKTYFDQGQTAYSTRGAKLSDGSTWYEIQAVDNGKTVRLWLKSGSSGVTVKDLSVPLSISFSPSSVTLNSGESKTVSINYKGENVYLPAFTVNDDSICSASWGDVDVNTGKAALIVTGKTAGSTSIKINLVDSNKKILYTKSFTVSVNRSQVSVSANPSSLSLDLASNNSGTVRVNISGPHGGLSGSGNGDGDVRAEWVDSGSGYAVAKFTGTKAGIINYTFRVQNEANTEVIASTTIRITITAPTYTVSYNANGGSGVPSSQTKQYDKTLTLSPTKPTRSGYTFKGWATSSGASSAQYQPSGNYTSNKNLTLYAVWEYNKVERSLNFSPSSLSMNVGTSKTVSLQFAGDDVQSIGGFINGQSLCDVSWGSMNGNAGTTSLTVTGKKAGTATITVNLMDKNEKTIYSKSFTATFVDPTYTVSYNANGGSGAPSSQTKQHDKTLTLSYTTPVRSGYTFKGWATSSGASSAQYQPGSSYTDNKNLTLYAVWELNKVESSLTFSQGVLTMDPGTSKTISVNFKGDGIKYLGFSPENKNNSICSLSWANIDWKNGTTSVTVTGKEPGTTTITVHLLDKNENSFFSKSFNVTVNSVSYTVSYNANGGSGAPSSQTKQYAKTLTLSSTKPTRDGYNFIGWAESPSALSAQFEPGDTFTGNKDLSLYAVWQIAHQHSLTHISEKPATETSEGNIEHWYCNGCGKYFSDAKAVNEISQSQTVLTKLKHTHSLTHYPDVASTCTKGGNLAYWRCGECGKYFSDAAGNSETSEALVSLQPLGHNYVNGVCTRDGAVDPKHSGQANEVHLAKQNSYSQGHFSDVYPNQWFTDNVASAYELGLMKGKSSRVFDPYGEVTLAETITMACRIHSIYTKGYEDIPPSNGGKWYQQYLDYAYQNNIISWTAYHNANVEGNATRVQFAEIMAKSLPEEGFYAMNSVQDDAIPDVSSADASASFVYKLYRAGILSGGDVRGTFSPQSYITRAEAATIISRVAESNNRVSFSLS